MKNNNKKFICLALDDDLRKQIKQEARQLGITMSAYIRMILIKRQK